MNHDLYFQKIVYRCYLRSLAVVKNLKVKVRLLLSSIIETEKGF